MTRTPLAVIVAGAAWAVAAATALAEPAPLKIDPNHSQVEFTIRHFFSRVQGRFNEFAGTILYDDKNLASSSVNVTIQTRSIFTNQDRRDNDLRSPRFFWADSFPTLTFKSTKVIPGEGTKFKVEGNLTIRGATKPVILDAEFLGMGAVGIEGQSMGTRAGFEATTTIDRKDFGVVWNQTLDQGGTMLGDDVSIHLAIEAVKAEKPDKAPAPGKSGKLSGGAGN
ncbi:MAG TPA: YceI family protein [Candidatus Eisenbacteria bacterium]|jgi:polyisoprenoid-binding protein YceI